MSNVIMQFRSLTSAAQETRNSQFGPQSSQEGVSSKGLHLLPMPAATKGLQSVQRTTTPRPKQVTDPLAEAVREGLHGKPLFAQTTGSVYSSSGSDHELSSACLAAMVDEFLENEAASGECGPLRCNCAHETFSGEAIRSSSHSDDFKSNFRCELLDFLRDLVRSVDTFEMSLLADVTRAIIENGEVDCATERAKRGVMKELRKYGYNAGLCKSRWSFSGVFPQGEYEYIDVLVDEGKGEPERFIVDIDFRAQFEIARPTNRYVNLLQALPLCFVGKPERLQQLVNVMSDSLRHSLRKRGLLLPPWRRFGYLTAKWFSAYKRTTNSVGRPFEAVDVVGFSGIAIRGSGLAVKFPSELEMHYQQADTMRLSKDRGEGKRGLGERNTKNTERSLPMETVRIKLGSRKNEISIAKNEWELPAVNVECLLRPRKVGGLRYVLMEAGIQTETKP